MDVAIAGALIATIFGIAGRRVAKAYGSPGWLGFTLAALVPPVGAVAGVWALAVDLPTDRGVTTSPRDSVSVAPGAGEAGTDERDDRSRDVDLRARRLAAETSRR